MNSKTNEKRLIERILVLVGRKTEDSDSICLIYDLLRNWFDEHPTVIDSFNISRLNSNFRFACLLSAISIYENLPSDFFKFFVPDSVSKICDFIFSYIDPETLAA